MNATVARDLASIECLALDLAALRHEIRATRIAALRMADRLLDGPVDERPSARAEAAIACLPH